MNNYCLSRPLRARGLKLPPQDKKSPLTVSRPLRARGLKRLTAHFPAERQGSRPLRARGLKQKSVGMAHNVGSRAPYGRVD